MPAGNDTPIPYGAIKLFASGRLVGQGTVAELAAIFGDGTATIEAGMELTDKELMEHGPVKSWLFQVTNLMRDIFSRSNTYRTLHQGYEELGLFGTWATAVAGSRHRKLVLIDTPGFGSADAEVMEETAGHLARIDAVECHLVLPATMR